MNIDFMDFSLKPIEKLKLSGFSSPLPDNTFQVFRRITSNFFETIAFSLLEHNLLKYDANDYMNFIERVRSTFSSFAQKAFLYLKTISISDLQSIFEKTSQFLENLNDMLLNSTSSREDVVKIMIQTLEEPNNNLLYGLGLYLKSSFIEYFDSKKIYYVFSNDSSSKYLNNTYFEKDFTFDEILQDLKELCEAQQINICVFFSKGGSCNHHGSKSEHSLSLIYLSGSYFLLYPDPKLQNSVVIPLPAPDIIDLIDSHYLGKNCAVSSNNTKLDNFDNRSYDTYKNANKVNMECDIERGCCLCLCKLYEKAFINSSCQHKFCYYCLVDKTQQKNCSSICYESTCIQSINFKEIEDYLIEMNLLRDFEDNGNLMEKIHCICSQCQSQEFISVSALFTPESFICSQCKDFQCLIHYDSNKVCQCLCEKCKQKLEYFPDIYQKTCKICVIKHCSICRKEKKNCKCFCEVCYYKKGNKSGKCVLCEKSCVNCGNEYKSNVLVMANCGKHWICRCCVIKEVEGRKFEPNGKRCYYCEGGKLK